MGRRTVTKNVLLGFVNAQMALIGDCAHCRCVGIKWREPVGDHCNWTVLGFEGTTCLKCLDSLTALLVTLREGFDIDAPNPRQLRGPQARTAWRQEVSVVPRGDQRAAASVDDVIADAALAVRESRALLRVLRESMTRTKAQRDRAIAACDAWRLQAATC